MLTQKTNYHHSEIPTIGSIGRLVMGYDRYNTPRYYRDVKTTWQCISYPLNDNVSPYSIGIHTANFKSLKNGSVVRVSGFYFHEK